jgi:hypothetical protein
MKLEYFRCCNTSFLVILYLFLAELITWPYCLSITSVLSGRLIAYTKLRFIQSWVQGKANLSLRVSKHFLKTYEGVDLHALKISGLDEIERSALGYFVPWERSPCTERMKDWKGARSNTDSVTKAYFSWRETAWRLATEIKKKNKCTLLREKPLITDVWLKPSTSPT